MALGPGRYDPELSDALRSIRARSPDIHGGMLIIIGPPERSDVSGFACQLSSLALPNTPTLLRQVADQIEADLERGRL
jgi:hypothetical protein